MVFKHVRFSTPCEKAQGEPHPGTSGSLQRLKVESTKVLPSTVTFVINRGPSLLSFGSAATSTRVSKERFHVLLEIVE